MFLNGAVTIALCVCVCSQFIVIEVIRVTLPELCAGSIIQSGYHSVNFTSPPDLIVGRQGAESLNEVAKPGLGFQRDAL